MPKTTEPVIEPRFLISRQTMFSRLDWLLKDLTYREANGKSHVAYGSSDVPTPELVGQIAALARSFATQLETEYGQRATERARQDARQAALEDLISERVGKAS